MKIIIANISVVLLLLSCTRLSELPQDNLNPLLPNGAGLFLINEGNFRLGNGSLSFYSYDSAKIYNNIFSKVNNRILGDVPNSMKTYGDFLYIIVNNSGKIEIVNKNTMKSVKTITGLISPRNIAFVDTRKAYVTSMYSDSITIIDLNSNSISGYINIRRTSEAIEVAGQKAFVAEWFGGKEVMVINTVNNKVIDSTEVGMEPESMVLDRNNTLWVLCNGGWERTNYAELIGLNTLSSNVQKRFIFPTRLASPSCLQINGKGDTLYYLENGVKYFPVNARELPSVPLISEEDHIFYKLGIDPVNSDIFITDAVDYQQKGFLLHYKHDGTFISQYQASILPGLMCFKVNENLADQ